MKVNKEKYAELMKIKGYTPDSLALETGMNIRALRWCIEGNPCTYGALEVLAVAVGADPKEIVEFDYTYEDNREGTIDNTVEFEKDKETATVMFCQGRYKSKIYKLAEQYPERCQILAENKDGSILAHIPVTWVRIQPPVEMNLSNEQREAIANRLAAGRIQQKS